MILLPKGNPLYENIPVSKVNLPEMLDKLNFGGFTGYLRFTFPDSQVICFFEGGKMLSALHEKSGGARTTSMDALSELCTLILDGEGKLDVYRISRDLTICLNASFHGDILFKGQELKLIDMRAVLEKMKSEKLNGCLRIYTDDHAALIFYKDGSPLGFFHDGSHDIETSATESQKIAALPGAKLDVLSSKSLDLLISESHIDLPLLTSIWGKALLKRKQGEELQKREREEQQKRAIIEKLGELEEDLKEMASAYIGKMGRILMEKEIAALGGRQILLSREGVTKLLAAMERGSKLLTSGTKIQEMLKALNDEITRRTTV
ncbi:MAG: PATAN domain-containing protein [Desulfuromonadia bacterium]